MTLSVDILEQAKAALQTHGWTKHDLVACNTGELCALGALNVALGVTVVQETTAAGDPAFNLRYPYQDLAPSKAQEDAIGQYPLDGTAEEREAWVDASNALWRAHSDAEWDFEHTFEAYDSALIRAVEELSGGDVSNVPSWNDREDSTLQDVLNVFDTAIKNIKEQEAASV